VSPNSLQVRSSMEISFASAKEAKAVMDSLQPDNVTVPQGLSIVLRTRKNHLLVEISSHVAIETFISTVDEILEHISLGTAVLSID
jgi:tRNA threonylcarbamoyladenosine modification (KEOPS) complex  Pcc1 subunit